MILEQGVLTQLLGEIIAAGGITRLPARTHWPMHVTLVDLYKEAGRAGALRYLPPAPEFVPNPEGGYAANGARSALNDLVRDGLLGREGQLDRACLLTD